MTQSLYADVIVDISHEKLDRTFQYRIPMELRDRIHPGSQVQIPFGNGNRRIAGYVMSIGSKALYEEDRIKEILSVDESAVTVESQLIATAAWMKKTYGSTMIQALKTVLPVKEHAKGRQIRRITLLPAKAQAEQMLAEYERKKYRARARLLSALILQPELDYSDAISRLSLAPDVIRKLEAEGVLAVSSDVFYRNPVRAEGQRRAYELSEAQQTVLDQIHAEWGADGQKRPVLLFGVTGSGKTAVYLELIAEVLAEGRQAIVLIPEIALTRQTVERFCARFGNAVTILHSRMTPAEKADQMERVRKGEVSIVIGPRSALFAPFERLGLILIDEEQESSYHSEVTPRYQALDVALYRASLAGAHVLAGSATPSVDCYYRCRQEQFALVTLKDRFGGAQLPRVEIVDLREELKEGNRSILSRSLVKEMALRKKRGEQTMLFLNRRGYAGFVHCRACGFVVKCPHCDVSLNLHNNGKLICHYCGFEQKSVTVCPSCGSSYIGGFRAGTQQIEQLIRKTFPGIRTLRMDADTTKQKNGHESILEAFANGEADVLIGTQMIVKGHDFPNVTLVGVLAADLSLFASSYTAGERTFDLVTQAVGRAGRGNKPGMAVIQTYHPEHYSIQTAAAQDYETFYKEEISYRKLMGYPPAARLLSVHTACDREELLEQAMEYIAKYLNRILPRGKAVVIGPTYESISKVSDLYRMVVYIKSPREEILIWMREKLEQYIELNKGFSKIYISYDLT